MHKLRLPLRIAQDPLRRRIVYRELGVYAVKDVVLFACVERLPHDPQLQKRIPRNAERITARSGERIVRRIELFS